MSKISGNSVSEVWLLRTWMSSLTGLCAANYQLAFFQELNETGPSVN